MGHSFNMRWMYLNESLIRVRLAYIAMVRRVRTASLLPSADDRHRASDATGHR